MVPTLAADTSQNWTRLDAGAKRRRLLRVASKVFGERGLDATMPAVAAAAGIGVGSLYRCFSSKEDLVAAIVVEQMESLRDEISAAPDDDPGPALEQTVRQLVARQAKNGLVRAALAATSERPDVRQAVDEVNLAWQQLLDAARRKGSVRSDATTVDVRLLFAATRAADEVEPGGRERMLELLLEALMGSGKSGR